MDNELLDVLKGIREELKAIRALKQIEMSISPVITKTAVSVEELALMVSAIKNPVKYMEGDSND